MQTKEQQIKELKTTAAIHLKVADKLQQQIEALEKPKQWEPRSCEYITTHHTERDTVEDAAKASAEMRTYSRLRAYVYQYGGGWVADWEDKQQKKYYVYYSYLGLGWRMQHAYNSTIGGTVYMSQDCAVGLANKLNSGEVVL